MEREILDLESNSMGFTSRTAVFTHGVTIDMSLCSLGLHFSIYNRKGTYIRVYLIALKFYVLQTSSKTMLCPTLALEDVVRG